MESLQNKFL